MYLMLIQPRDFCCLQMASSKKRRTQLSNAEKLEIVRHAHENQLSHVDAAYWYNSAHPGTNLSEDAVRKWKHKGLEYWEQQGICHESSKRNRHGKYPALEATLFVWMKQARSVAQ